MYKMRLFGGFEVLRDGKTITSFRTQKARALLAYLALNADKPLARKALAGLFWPESSSERAGQNLRQALMFLRQALDVEASASPLHTSRHDISFTLTELFFVDVIAFESGLASAEYAALETAVGLYRGSLLEGIFIDDSSEFELWLIKERERYHRQALAALEKLADFQLKRGAYELAKTYLTQALTLTPWHEAAHRGLMRALALSGDTTGALAQYDKCRRILQDELAVTPLEATQLLVEQIRAGEVGGQPASLPTTTAVQSPQPQFIGRGNEHAQLTAALSALNQTQPVTVFVEGEVGAGKTRLIEEFNRFAISQRALVLRGRCFEFGETMPYQPFVEMLRAALKLYGEQLQLPAVWLAELSRLLPDLVDLYPELPETQRAAGEAARQHLFAAVGRFLHGLASKRQPIILFLDDLQWADTTTIDLLHYLIRQSQDTPMLFLGSYRPEETPATHPLTILRRGLSRERLVRLIHLRPLAAEAIQHIAAQLVETAVARQFGDFLLQESEGNPFVMTEVLNTLYEAELLQPAASGQWTLVTDWQSQTTKMSASLRDTILNRVERLPEPARELLEVAAVIGRTFEADLLRTFGKDTVETTLEIWQQRRLVRQVAAAKVGRQYDFTHDKIREVIYHQLPTTQRQHLHRQVGEGLERQAASLPNGATLASAIAHHYCQSDKPRHSLPFLLTAAQQAQQALAFATVIRFCSQALDLEPDDLDMHFEFLRLRQESSEYLGETAMEEADALAMLAIAEQQQNTQQAVLAQKRMSIFYMHRNPMKARDIIARMLPLYQATGDKASQVETLRIAAILSRNAGETQQAFSLFNQSRRIAHEIGDAQSEGFSLGYVAMEQIRHGLFAEAAVNYERGAKLLRTVNEQSVELGYHLIGTTNLYRILGQYEEAKRTIEEAWQIGDALAHTSIQCWVHNHRGKIALWQEQPDEAHAHYQAAFAVADKHHFGILKGHALWGLGLFDLANENFGQAQEKFLQALEQFRGSHAEMVTVTQAYLGLAYLGLDNLAAALAQTESAVNTIEAMAGLFIEMQQIYLCHYRVLTAVGKTSEAQYWLDEGRKIVMTQAADLDESWRDRFTTAVPVNRQLLHG